MTLEWISHSLAGNTSLKRREKRDTKWFELMVPGGGAAVAVVAVALAVGQQPSGWLIVVSGPFPFG